MPWSVSVRATPAPTSCRVVSVSRTPGTRCWVAAQYLRLVPDTRRYRTTAASRYSSIRALNREAKAFHVNDLWRAGTWEVMVVPTEALASAPSCASQTCRLPGYWATHQDDVEVSVDDDLMLAEYRQFLERSAMVWQRVGTSIPSTISTGPRPTRSGPVPSPRTLGPWDAAPSRVSARTGPAPRCPRPTPPRLCPRRPPTRRPERAVPHCTATASDRPARSRQRHPAFQPPA